MVGIRNNPPESEETMDTEYGVNVYNKFALFLEEDDDPIEILKAREAELLKRKEEKVKKDKSKDATKPAKAKAPVKKVSNDAQTGLNEPPIAEKKEVRVFNKPRETDRRVFGQANIPPRRGGFGSQATDTFEKPPSSDLFGSKEQTFNDRGRGMRGARGGRGLGRGGRGGRGRGIFDDNGGRFGKRQYDRQSGSDKTGVFSGIKPVDKRDGGGSYNWGNIKDDMTEPLNESQLTNEETSEWTAANEDIENQEPVVPTEPSVEENVETDAVDEPAEPAKEMTLDEYKAQLANKRALASFNPRQANEGSDQAQWKKMFEYKKAATVSDEEESDDESDDERAKKKTVDIEITFNDESNRRGGPGNFRGGRGRGRGGAGGRGAPRGGFRGGRGGFNEDGNRARAKEITTDDGKSVANINDEMEFPSLI